MSPRRRTSSHSNPSLTFIEKLTSIAEAQEFISKIPCVQDSYLMNLSSVEDIREFLICYYYPEKMKISHFQIKPEQKHLIDNYKDMAAKIEMVCQEIQKKISTLGDQISPEIMEFWKKGPNLIMDRIKAAKPKLIIIGSKGVGKTSVMNFLTDFSLPLGRDDKLASLKTRMIFSERPQLQRVHQQAISFSGDPEDFLRRELLSLSLANEGQVYTIRSPKTIENGKDLEIVDSIGLRRETLINETNDIVEEINSSNLFLFVLDASSRQPFNFYVQQCMQFLERRIDHLSTLILDKKLLVQSIIFVLSKVDEIEINSNEIVDAIEKKLEEFWEIQDMRPHIIPLDLQKLLDMKSHCNCLIGPPNSQKLKYLVVKAQYDILKSVEQQAYRNLRGILHDIDLQLNLPRREQIPAEMEQLLTNHKQEDDFNSLQLLASHMDTEEAQVLEQIDRWFLQSANHLVTVHFKNSDTQNRFLDISKELPTLRNALSANTDTVGKTINQIVENHLKTELLYWIDDKACPLRQITARFNAYVEEHFSLVESTLKFPIDFSKKWLDDSNSPPAGSNSMGFLVVAGLINLPTFLIGLAFAAPILATDYMQKRTSQRQFEQAIRENPRQYLIDLLKEIEKTTLTARFVVNNYLYLYKEQFTERVKQTLSASVQAELRKLNAIIFDRNKEQRRRMNQPINNNERRQQQRQRTSFLAEEQQLDLWSLPLLLESNQSTKQSNQPSSSSDTEDGNQLSVWETALTGVCVADTVDAKYYHLNVDNSQEICLLREEMPTPLPKKRLLEVWDCYTSLMDSQTMFLRPVYLKQYPGEPERVGMIFSCGPFQGEPMTLLDFYLDNKNVQLYVPAYEQGEPQVEKQLAMNFYLDVLHQVLDLIEKLANSDMTVMDMRPEAIIAIPVEDCVRIHFAELGISLDSHLVHSLDPVIVHYLPPECFRGQQHSLQADIYRFGLLAYELYYCVEKPSIPNFNFDGDFEMEPANRLKHKDPDFPPQLKELIADCMAFSPRKRPSLKEIKFQLDELKMAYEDV